MKVRGGKIKTKEFYGLMLIPERNELYTQSGWYTSKVKAKEAFSLEDFNKVLFITDDIIELINKEEKYLKKFHK